MSIFWPILQVSVVVLETYIRLKVTSPHRTQRRIGYACAVAAQFFWLVIFLHFGQYWLLPLLIIDGTIWYRGLMKSKPKPTNDSEISI